MSLLSANIHTSSVLADESWALGKEEDTCIQLTTACWEPEELDVQEFRATLAEEVREACE